MKTHKLITGEKGLGMSYSTTEIRGLADFNRFDMNRSQRRKYHRKLKLIKKDIIRDAISFF